MDYLQSLQQVLPVNTVTYIDLDQPMMNSQHHFSAPAAFDEIIYSVTESVSLCDSCWLNFIKLGSQHMSEFCLSFENNNCSQLTAN